MFFQDQKKRKYAEFKKAQLENANNRPNSKRFKNNDGTMGSEKKKEDHSKMLN